MKILITFFLLIGINSQAQKTYPDQDVNRVIFTSLPTSCICGDAKCKHLIFIGSSVTGIADTAFSITPVCCDTFQIRGKASIRIDTTKKKAPKAIEFHTALICIGTNVSGYPITTTHSIGWENAW